MPIPVETLGGIGEREWLRRLCPGLPDRNDVVLAAGDDAALVRCGGIELALTSDALLQGRHFLPQTDPRRIGHKALARALSDLAAMGADAAWALIDLEAPADTPVHVITAIYEGLNALARRFEVAIVGGDTTESATLGLHVFAVGHLPAGSARRRKDARVGDRVLVTGPLGDSRRGHHLDFIPRLAEGRLLRDHVHAMIDVSDGLSVDARHLAEASGVAIVLQADAIPLRSSLAQLPPADALYRALHDGEDFELLFTVDPANAGRLQQAWQTHFSDPPPVVIGRVESGPPALWLEEAEVRRPLRARGYDHFRKEQLQQPSHAETHRGSA